MLCIYVFIKSIRGYYILYLKNMCVLLQLGAFLCFVPRLQVDRVLNIFTNTSISVSAPQMIIVDNFERGIIEPSSVLIVFVLEVIVWLIELL